MSAPKASRWIKVFREFTKDLRINSKEESSDDDRGIPFVLWNSQNRFLDFLADGLDNGIRKFYVSKSRQLGVTTASLAIDVLWLAMHKNLACALVTENEKNRDKNRAILRRYINSFEPGYFGDSFHIIKGGDNRNSMRFSNGSRIDFLVAGVRDKGTSWGEGEGYAFAHLCVAPGTPVIIDNGRIKPIEDIQVGDRVLTHTGAPATVIDVVGQVNDKGPMMRLTPWLGEPVTCTLWHKIPTQRGLVEAQHLTADDRLIMSVRTITHDRMTARLPRTKRVAHSATDALGWIRVLAAGSGQIVTLDEEFGYAMGYYLAEGTVTMTKSGPSGITFARHRDEIAYADRAIKALMPYITGNRRTVDVKNSLTSTDTVYGSPLATWVAETFGKTDGKIIPDEVFMWGEDFCRGLLCGLLCGDGSKSIVFAPNRERVHLDTIGTRGGKVGAPRKGLSEPGKRYPLNYVVLPTTRASLATQARDLAASLGYGWAAIGYEAPAVKHGRVCKAQWRLRWSGAAAGRLRALMGLSVCPSSDTGSRQKYEIKDGLVLIKIRKIEHGIEEPEMWDVSVDHPDHTFRTPFMAIGNTECASYGSSEGLDSFEESFSQSNPNRLFIYESTSKGFNHWRTRYQQAESDLYTKRALFLGWWSGDHNRIEQSDPRFLRYGGYAPSGEEREKVAAVAHLYSHKITPEQLAWIRWRDDTASGEAEAMLRQNQPWTAEESFVVSGFSFFQTRLLGQSIKTIIDTPEGPVEDGGYGFVGYRYELEGRFFDIKLVLEEDDIQDVTLRIWEEPVPEGQYVIGFDPAWGRNPHGDRHAISVWRCFADRLVQVAEYADKDVEMKHATWVCAHLAGAYVNCIVNFDVNGPGQGVFAEWDSVRGQLNAEMNENLVRARDWENALGQARWYLYHRPDSMGAGYAYAYQTSGRGTEVLMHGFRGAHVSGELVIRSLPMLQEMCGIVQDGAEIGAPESSSEEGKDDRVFAAALAQRAWSDWVKPGMIAQGLTYERSMKEERGEVTKQTQMLNGIVSRFFLTAQEKADTPESPPKWLSDRGLA